MVKRKSKRDVLVYAHWESMPDPILLGMLHSELLRGKEIFSFEYNETWLQSKYAQLLDPDLELFSGLHYLTDRKMNFGMFLDSSPDRWGRILMQRREAALARREERDSNNLFETDYLLGVFDGHRMGALRFKTDSDGPFLSDNKELASPPWTSIRELEEISLRLEVDNVEHNPEYMKWLNMLVAPGSSLGGARPKASIIDQDGKLWIAKFPSLHDRTDIGGWEIVTYELAKKAGIHMAECQARKFSSNYHTFLTNRFDRNHNGERIHFASAMTMLGYMDGQDGASYLDLVEFLTTKGANVDADLEELWRRIVFSICVSNSDDHLRNHGFILTQRGWLLSPAYDINPVETATGLSLNVSENDNALDLSLALDVCEYFRLTRKRANEIISKVTTAVKNWPRIADRYGISRSEQALKSKAFSRAMSL